MKKLAIGVIAVAALFGTPALAADSWSGFYLGLNAGWGWGKAKETTTATTGFSSFAPTFVDSTHPGGAIGGIQLGYNWKSLPNWIFGIEADIQASGQNASSAPLSQSFFTSFIFFELSASDLNSHNDALNWFGTVRGRVGYAIWPTTMLYATGGFAYGRISTSVTNTTTATLCEFQFCFGPFSSTATLNGAAVEPGWTAGGGIEGAVPNTRVTWKVEYLYIALNTASFSITTPFPVVTSVRFTDNIVRVGLNWHLN